MELNVKSEQKSLAAAAVIKRPFTMEIAELFLTAERVVHRAA